MEQILKKLSEIESVAEGIMENAAKEKKALSENMENQIKAYDLTIEKETEQRVKEIRENLNKEKEQRLIDLRQETNEDLSKLDSYFEANHSVLAKQIMEEIINL